MSNLGQVTINGVTYNLIPANEQGSKSEDLLSKYVSSEPTKEGEVPDAVGEVSEYRERYKSGELTMADVAKAKRGGTPDLDRNIVSRANSFLPAVDGDTIRWDGNGVEEDLIL